MNKDFPFWDDSVVVTRVAGQRHFVVLPGSTKKEAEMSFCNFCGSPFTIKLLYENRVVEVCPGCGTEMMQGNG